MLIIILALQGGVLFAGLSLGINAAFLQTTNWVFILIMTTIGTLLGGILGVLLHNNSPAGAWLMPVGSLISAILVGGLAVAFDYFIGPESMHWRGIIALMMICSAPGLFLGWLIGQQVSGSEDRNQASRRRRGRAEIGTARRRPAPVPPAPMGGTGDGSERLHGERLARILQSETQEVAGIRNVSGVEVSDVQGAGGSKCVTVTVPGQAETLQIYLICTPQYPERPPQLMAEAVDPRHGRSREIDVSSEVIARWNQQSRLSDVVRETIQQLAR